MCDPLTSNSWAVRTENINSEPDVFEYNHGITEELPSPDKRRLSGGERRYSLRIRDGSGDASPIKYPHNDKEERKSSSNVRQRLGQRNVEEGEEGHGPNYRRDKNGLGPLRSPLTADLRTSRLSQGSRRRSIKDESSSRHRDSDHSKNSSPSKRNRQGGSDKYSPRMPPLTPDNEERRFRRRLELPSDESTAEHLLNPENEEDQIIIARREKQIVYGKATESYKHYLAVVPREERVSDRKVHPKTPNKLQRSSRRNWDAQVKAWKKYVHDWGRANGMSDNASTVGSESVSEDFKTDENFDINEEDDISFLEGVDIHD